MSNGQVEVITSVERRRRWSGAEKERLVAASLEAGSSVSAVARAAGLHPSQLYGWRRQLCRPARSSSAFAAVRIAGESAPSGWSAAGGLIEIEFAGGTRLRIGGAVDPATLRATLVALTGGGRRR